MASLLSSTNLVEHAANDDIVTVPRPGPDHGRIRLADRISAIKPARPKPAQEADVEIHLPAIVPIVSTALVPYRVTEALSLEALMRKPEPVPAVTTDNDASPDDLMPAEATSPDPANNGTSTEITPRVSEVPPLSAGSRLAELILEQRALIEDLTRLSQRVVAVTSASGGLVLPESSASPGSDGHEPLDVVSAAIATYPAPEPVEIQPPPSQPNAQQSGAHSADEMIRVLASVVEKRSEPEHQALTRAEDGTNEPLTSTTATAGETYPQHTSTAPSDWLRAPGGRTTPLVHAPEPLDVASLIDEERPPMIIERAYTSLPEHELGNDLPRAPGFLGGLALSGVAGLALFFVLRVA